MVQYYHAEKEKQNARLEDKIKCNMPVVRKENKHCTRLHHTDTHENYIPDGTEHSILRAGHGSSWTHHADMDALGLGMQCLT